MDNYYERFLPYPELNRCKGGGGGSYCARVGCIFEQMERKVDPSFYGLEGAEEKIEEINEMARENGCKRIQQSSK